MNELQTIEPEVVAQPALFDYGALDAEARIVIQQRAGEIKTLAKRMASDVVEIGGKLAEVKDRLGGNGRFNDWLSAELGWSERTAYNFIAVWQKFNGVNFALENVATSALYLLAAPSTPAEAVEAAKQIADSGERVTHALAEEIVRQAKDRGPKQDSLIDGTDDDDEETEGQRDGDTEEEAAETAPAEEAELPPGWVWSHRDSRVPSFSASNPASDLRTLKLRTEAEVIAAAYEIEKTRQEGLAGLAGSGLSSKGDKPPSPAPAKPAAAGRPAAWNKARVEIVITLLPGPEPRKVMHSVRAGDGSGAIPFVAVSAGEAELLKVLPPITRDLVEKAAKAFANKPKPASKTPTKSTSKTVAKKPAAKKNNRGGKK